MSQDIPLPKKPGWLALTRYKLAFTGARFIPHTVLAIILGGALFSAVWLLGYLTPQWIALSDEQAENPLPREQWPEIPDLAKPRILGEDGNPATLSLIDVRGRLIDIDANAKRKARGEELMPLPAPTATANPRPAEAAALEAYDDWASGSACSISGWSDDAREQVAALVRNGVWNCSAAKRYLASWQMVIKLGLWPGLFLTLLLLGAIGVASWVVARLMLRNEQDYRLHKKLFGSWAG